jgi:hypothetical protein
VIRAFVSCLLAVSVVFGLGCASKESEPVSVARAFADTARRGDVDGMLAVIEGPAVERLESAAEHASDHVGGRRSIEAAEMLQIVGVDRSVAVAGAELLDDNGERAHVELTMTDGRTLRLELVWEQPEQLDEDAVEDPAHPTRAGGWKVRIPLPSAAPVDEFATGAAPPDA